MPILGSKVHRIKEEMALKYEGVDIPRHPSSNRHRSESFHADETKGVVYSGGHYVWIFANLD